MSDKPMAKILVVDDHLEKAEDLITELRIEEPSWEILTGESWPDALRVLKTHAGTEQPVSVVITDLELKDEPQGGVKLIKDLQGIDPLAMSIVYTAKKELLDRSEVEKLGAVDVVTKGGVPEDHVQRIVSKTRAALRYRTWALRVEFLRRYFDPRLFESLVGSADDLLEPRSRRLTIAFWDIRGFSALSECLAEEPHLIARFLRVYCEMVATTVFNHGGLLDKFMGDGVMALFGVVDQTDDGQRKAARDAALAAQELRNTFPALVKHSMPEWRTHARQIIEEPRLACGIHTGRSIVGNMGTDFRDQFTAVGPHVNFAQRLESLAGKGKTGAILLSQPTFMHLQAVPEVKLKFFRSFNDVKNIPGEYRVYELTR